MCMYCACFLMLEYAKTDKIRQNGQRLLLKVSKKTKGLETIKYVVFSPLLLGRDYWTRTSDLTPPRRVR